MHRTVDFFIVGEPKSGTTALAKFLGQHPDIGISSPKEPHYFAVDLHRESDDYHSGKRRHFEVRTLEEYESCFNSVKEKPVWGEASTHYMCSHEAAEKIRLYNPAAKIIVMLRNPVDFLHSLHMQYVNNGSEDEHDFERALALEQARRAGRNIPGGTRCPSHLHYSERVRYAEHLARFRSQFPSEQIKVIITEEFNADNEGTYLDVLKFLDVGLSAPLPEFTVVHGSKAPRFKLLHKALNHIALKNSVMRLVGPSRYDRVKNRVATVMLKKQTRPDLSRELRTRLMCSFEPEVRKISEVVKRPDLPRIWGYEK